jgi:hypothetical protein
MIKSDFLDLLSPMILSIVSNGNMGDISSMGGAKIEPSF